MKKILFIDDEKNILKALRRLFRNLEFECYYAQTIREAVEIFASLDELDMIVSDIKMPHFDGIQTLKLFKEASPETIRVALSGYASTSSITEAVSKNLAKQYFHKPWHNEQFVDSIRKMFALEDTLKSAHLFQYAQKFEGVKTIPKLFNEINLAISRDRSVEAISELVNKDPAIASNILRIANSAFYAAKTGDLQQAIMFIGLNNLKQIVLSYEVSNMSSKLYEDSACIWTHSMRTNKIFHDLYERYYRKKVPGIISTAGLMHDIGKIIMLQLFGSSYYDNVIKPEIRDDKLLETEVALYGIDHSLVGGYFLNWWAFPYDIIEATLFHHTPEDLHVANKELVALMCLASQIEENDEHSINSNYLYAMEVLGYKESDLAELKKKYQEETT